MRGLACSSDSELTSYSWIVLTAIQATTDGATDSAVTNPEATASALHTTVQTAGMQRITARVGVLSLTDVARADIALAALLTDLPALEPVTASQYNCKRALDITAVVAELCASKIARHVYALIDTAADSSGKSHDVEVQQLYNSSSFKAASDNSQYTEVFSHYC
jgi:hypothetical protein